MDSDEDEFVTYDQSQSQPLPNIEDSSSSESQDENSVPKKRTRGKDIPYIEHRRFETQAQFNDFWLGEKERWRFKKRDYLGDTDVELWLCKYGRMKGYACRYRIRVEFPQDNLSVVVYHSDLEHDHQPIQQVSALSVEAKAFIRDQLRNGTAPQRIQVLMTERRLPSVPTLRQIQNFAQRERKETRKAFTDHDFRTYCEGKAQAPDDPNEPYVLAWSYESDDRFYVLWTTGKLRELQGTQSLLQADSTSGVNYNAFPLGVYGFSNINHSFTPTYLSMGPCENSYHYEAVFSALAGTGYQPRYVLGDGHAGLTKAVRDLFPEATRLMCNAHVDRNVTKNIVRVPEVFRDRIRSDVEALRYARNEEEFDRLALLMMSTWPDCAAPFKDYFAKTWATGDLKLWFEGASPYPIPSSNNGLECTNRSIKQAHTVRSKVDLRTFLGIVENALRNWSTNAQAVPELPTLKPHHYVDAYNLQGGVEKRLVARMPQRNIYVYASSASKITAMGDLREAYRAFTTPPATWDAFLNTRFRVYVVRKLPGDGQRLYCCSCWEGSKKHVCKHSVHAMCSPEVGLFSYPEEATAVPLGSKRKRGRPRKVAVQNRFAVR